MKIKDLFFYALILILAILFLWQLLSKGSLISQLNKLQGHNNQLLLLAGMDPFGSAHLHADVKVYINGNPLDFSQKKYQLATSFIHFEEGIGDVIHTHATGLTLGHLFRSLGGDLSNNCIVIEGQSHCSDAEKTLKFYANGQPGSEFDSRVIRDLDKYLISYGNENEQAIQKQLSSITNLAPRYSSDKFG